MQNINFYRNIIKIGQLLYSFDKEKLHNFIKINNDTIF